MSDNITRIVTPQRIWEVQVCDNSIGAYTVHSTFDNIDVAQGVFDNFKVRLVQKSLIEMGEK
jgi:hypothetical protein